MLSKIKKDKNGSLGNKPRNGSYFKCKVCQKQCYVKPFNSLTAKYCSYECKNKGTLKGKSLICKICGKSYYRPPSQVKWRGSSACSWECNKKAISLRNKGKIVSKVWSMRQADKTFSDFIRIRDDWECRACKKNFKDKSGQLHNSHFWSRKRWSTRFDPDNCIALCYSCHLWNYEKEKQGLYKDLMIKWLGIEKYDLLRKKAELFVKKEDSIKEFMGWIKPNLIEIVSLKKRTAMVSNEFGMRYWD